MTLPDDDGDGRAHGQWSPASAGRALLAWADEVAREGRGPAAQRLRAAAHVLLDLSLHDADQAAAVPGAARLRATPVHPAGGVSHRRVARTDLDPMLDVLTSSELNVAVAVAAGHSNKQVAARLSVSPRTVEIHLTRVYANLGLRGRVDLTRLMLGLSAPSPEGRSHW